ncbi:hypothetical protein [Oscillatoria salina]|uniref:hypothetical protein n=1 Tax=Oscillatoria salina TaxID=331517 RepID=UPI0013BCBDFD|nr:hypothetical protein [Oscillatoria salina]MBZ8178566.1 hypothetical protein [Oscillatoria salina IIICB1]NET90899.1 hypothetical protein [Kamptonema sp. SIO1D9]
MDDGLFDILAKIKARPGMYIGQPSVSNLFMFLAGYKTARRELKIEPTTAEKEFYREFQNFLQRRLKVQTVNSWAKMIMLYSVDEEEGFAYFFKLLEEFKQRDKSLDGDWLEEIAKNENKQIKQTAIKRK